MTTPVDLVVANGRVVALDPRWPMGTALAAHAGRVLLVGSWADVRRLVGPGTDVVDAGGGLVVPAFHDAHMHFLSYARATGHLDCRDLSSRGAVCMALAAWARELPAGTWIRAVNYDEARFPDRRHLERQELDAAVPNHPVRIQHRSLHLDVLNTLALRQLGLFESTAPQIERDPRGTEPTGRLYHAGELLHGRLPRPSERDLEWAVTRASSSLLAEGIASFQDATITNGEGELALFERLVARGAIRQRVFFLPGVRHWRAIPGDAPRAGAVRLGPVKLIVDEALAEPGFLEAEVAALRAAGRAAAIHACTEAEVVVALNALQAGRRANRSRPDRLEHAFTLPDALLPDVRRSGVMVVGQPVLVYLRGDRYLADHPAEQHGWLHRARSLEAWGIRFAAGSDAPVGEPRPSLGLFAARKRRTRAGALLGGGERLNPLAALAAHTLRPAEAVGAERELGHLGPGACADLVVLDPEALDPAADQPPTQPVRVTVVAGRVAWVRDARRVATGFSGAVAE